MLSVPHHKCSPRTSAETRADSSVKHTKELIHGPAHAPVLPMAPTYAMHSGPTRCVRGPDHCAISGLNKFVLLCQGCPPSAPWVSATVNDHLIQGSHEKKFRDVIKPPASTLARPANTDTESSDGLSERSKVFTYYIFKRKLSPT